jgi:SRSO17 transposase
VNQGEFDQVATSFAAFHREFAPLFGRKEARERSEQYLRGLLVQQTDRRNAENIAETIDGATPRTLQRLLTEAPWPTEPVIDRLQGYLGARLSTPEGVFVIDETGFPKKGKKSVGVGPQYCGVLGKIANCQIGVFLAYVSPRGHALADKRLFLPEEWTNDPERCREAGVPRGTGHQTKAELGLAMLGQARAAGHLAGRWVTADEHYGQVPSFREALDAQGWWYVVEVPCNTGVFERPLSELMPEQSKDGRPLNRWRLLRGGIRPQTVQLKAAKLAPEDWQVLTVAEGAQGPRSYQFAAMRVWESREGVPGRECWLILRRNLDESELKYYLSNAPASTSLLTLGQVGAMRWPIETEFQTNKGETGLDEYEVRSWQGWHHHITLAMLAGAFLLSVQQDWGKKDAPTDTATGQSCAATATAATHVDARRPAALARRDPGAKRTRKTVTHQAPSPQIV